MMMSYKNKLSNIEFMLAQIIWELETASGYRINKIIIERQYRNWADIGTTSVYSGLEKLRRRRLIDSKFMDKKSGKGPVPKLFKLTAEGKKILKQEVINSLEFSRERDKRFELSLAASPILKTSEFSKALFSRIDFLRESYKIIEQKFKVDGGDKLPLHVKALFEHSLFLISNEIDFTNEIIRQVE
jgi:DNA-binding PadR family transcriptional regulator